MMISFERESSARPRGDILGGADPDDDVESDIASVTESDGDSNSGSEAESSVPELKKFSSGSPQQGPRLPERTQSDIGEQERDVEKTLSRRHTYDVPRRIPKRRSSEEDENMSFLSEGLRSTWLFPSDRKLPVTEVSIISEETKSMTTNSNSSDTGPDQKSVSSTNDDIIYIDIARNDSNGSLLADGGSQDSFRDLGALPKRPPKNTEEPKDCFHQSFNDLDRSIQSEQLRTDQTKKCFHQSLQNIRGPKKKLSYCEDDMEHSFQDMSAPRKKPPPDSQHISPKPKHEPMSKDVLVRNERDMSQSAPSFLPNGARDENSPDFSRRPGNAQAYDERRLWHARDRGFDYRRQYDVPVFADRHIDVRSAQHRAMPRDPLDRVDLEPSPYIRSGPDPRERFHDNRSYQDLPTGSSVDDANSFHAPRGRRLIRRTHSGRSVYSDFDDGQSLPSRGECSLPNPMPIPLGIDQSPPRRWVGERNHYNRLYFDPRQRFLDDRDHFGRPFVDSRDLHYESHRRCYYQPGGMHPRERYLDDFRRPGPDQSGRRFVGEPRQYVRPDFLHSSSRSGPRVIVMRAGAVPATRQGYHSVGRPRGYPGMQPGYRPGPSHHSGPCHGDFLHAHPVADKRVPIMRRDGPYDAQMRPGTIPNDAEQSSSREAHSGKMTVSHQSIYQKWPTGKPPKGIPEGEDFAGVEIAPNGGSRLRRTQDRLEASGSHSSLNVECSSCRETLYCAADVIHFNCPRCNHFNQRAPY